MQLKKKKNTEGQATLRDHLADLMSNSAMSNARRSQFQSALTERPSWVKQFLQPTYQSPVSAVQSADQGGGIRGASSDVSRPGRQKGDGRGSRLRSC